MSEDTAGGYLVPATFTSCLVRMSDELLADSAVDVSLMDMLRHPERYKAPPPSWEREPEVYCPSCGERRVVVETGGGDYYEGPEFTCLGCGDSFALLGHGPQDDETMAKIRATME